MGGRAIRSPDASGQAFAMHEADVLDGQPSADIAENIGLAATTAFPLVWRRVTPIAGVSAAGKYPAEGDNLIDTGSDTGQAILDTAAAFDQDMIGLRYFHMTGSGRLGQTRIIRDWNGTTRAATVGDGVTSDDGLNFDSAPQTGDEYALAIDAYKRTQVWIKAEFQNGGAVSCTVVPILFSYPRDPSAGTAATDGVLGKDTTNIAPIVSFGTELVIRSSQITWRPSESSYYHGFTMGDVSMSAYGVAVYLITPPTTENVTLWVAAI